MAKRKKARTRIPWSKSEIKLLRKIYRNMITADVAKKLNRSVTSVQARDFLLGLRKTKKHLKSIGKG